MWLDNMFMHVCVRWLEVFVVVVVVVVVSVWYDCCLFVSILCGPAWVNSANAMDWWSGLYALNYCVIMCNIYSCSLLLAEKTLLSVE